MASQFVAACDCEPQIERDRWSVAPTETPNFETEKEGAHQTSHMVCLSNTPTLPFPARLSYNAVPEQEY